MAKTQTEEKQTMINPVGAEVVIRNSVMLAEVSVDGTLVALLYGMQAKFGWDESQESFSCDVSIMDKDRRFTGLIATRLMPKNWWAIGFEQPQIEEDETQNGS